MAGPQDVRSRIGAPGSAALQASEAAVGKVTSRRAGESVVIMPPARLLGERRPVAVIMPPGAASGSVLRGVALAGPQRARDTVAALEQQPGERRLHLVRGQVGVGPFDD